MGEREGSEGQEKEGGALSFTLRDNQLGTVRPRTSERTTWSLLDHLLAFGCGRTPPHSIHQSGSNAEPRERF